MDFAGGFVYVPTSENNENDFEEVEVQIEDAAQEPVGEANAAPAPRAPAMGGARMCMPPPPPMMKKQRVRKANTNVLAIDLSTLASNAEQVPGDALLCGSCSAVFSSHSKVEANDTWVCEFCNHANIAQLDDEEKPKSETVEFLVEPAPAAKAADAASPLIIFCVDISGSMCSSTEVPGNFKLKGVKAPSANFLLEAGDDRNQMNSRGVTYVSRLQCVQAAIESQLETMSTQMPNARVALVTFNRDVTVYGDCVSTSVPTVVSGSKLDSYDQLFAIGQQHKNMKPISETKLKIVEKLMALEEDGATALGPAIAVCLGMTHDSIASRIVLATDGLSNTGVGAMDIQSLLGDAEKYYEKLSGVAKTQSTTVNIVGIRGGDSVRMTMLGKLADSTQGEVNLVDPLNIVSEFASMLNTNIVATNVTVKLLLHKGLSLVTADASKLMMKRAPGPGAGSDSEEAQRNNTEQVVGNAYEDSELTFEYEVLNAAKLKEIFDARARILALPGDLPADQKNLPFQVQIKYTKLDGSKCLRTITRTQAITHDRGLVEQNVNATMLGTHAWAQSAQLAERGHYEAAILNNAQMSSTIARASPAAALSSNYAAGTANFNQHMRAGMRRQQEQQSRGLFSASSAALDDDDEAQTTVLQFKSARKTKKGL